MACSTQHASALAPAHLDDESLLQLALVRAALDDPAVRWCARPVDASWYYAGLIPQLMVGFAPASGAIYHAASSATAAWLAEPGASARRFNEKDRLVREVLFGVHDYLHNLAYRAIAHHHPELDFGTGALAPDTLELHAFLHLLTEAVATVGLDYWYLCAFDLDQRLHIGTGLRSLTVSYRVEDEAEYGRFAPGFTAQEPEFLARLCEFYCTGAFEGFDLDDARQSPRLMSWLTHELAYGAQQRRYTRQWLAYLADGDVRLDARTLAAPVACDAPWQRALMDAMGHALWAFVKHGQPPLGVGRAAPWTAPRTRVPDFRFANLAAFDLEQIAHEAAAGFHTQQSIAFAFDQYVSAFDYRAFDPDLRALIPDLRRRGDLQLALRLFRREQRLAPEAAPPRDLFFLG